MSSPTTPLTTVSILEYDKFILSDELIFIEGKGGFPFI
jgi:hypothetical protein